MRFTSGRAAARQLVQVQLQFGVAGGGIHGAGIGGVARVHAVGGLPRVGHAVVVRIRRGRGGPVVRPAADFLLRVDDLTGALADVRDNAGVHGVPHRHGGAHVFEHRLVCLLGALGADGRHLVRRLHDGEQLLALVLQGLEHIVIVGGEFGPAFHEIAADVIANIFAGGVAPQHDGFALAAARPRAECNC